MITVGSIAEAEIALTGTPAWFRALATEERKRVVANWKVDPEAPWRPWWVESATTRYNALANAYTAAADLLETA